MSDPAPAGVQPSATCAQLPLPPVDIGAQGWALFLDLDGTLCPLVDRPEQVDLTAAQRELLRRVDRLLDGAVCVVSGRTRQDLARIFRDVPIRLVGAHGAEAPDFPDPRRDHAQQELRGLHPSLQQLVDRHDGLWLEDKGHAIALHYRQRPELGAELDAAARALLSAAAGLRLMHGNRVIELLPTGVSKGHALQRAMGHPDFAGRTPVAIGDDVTDEDTFAAAQASGGFGIHVGARPDTVAQYRLPCVVLVNTWLATLVARAGGARSLHGGGCRAAAMPEQRQPL